MTTGVRGWKPLEGVAWTASTRSSKMRNLVDNREAFFEVQRRYANVETQVRGHRLVQPLLDSENLQKNGFLANFQRYSEFCQMLDVPPFPCSTTMIALFVFAKTSYSNGHYATARTYLRTVWRNVHMWDNEFVCGAIGDDADLALREFLAERAHIPCTVTSGNQSKDLRADHCTSSSLSESSSSSQEKSSECDQDDTSPTVTPAEPRQEEVTPAEPRQEVDQVPTFGLPRDGQVFYTFDEMVVACYVPLVLTYGNGAHHSGRSAVRCGRYLCASATEGRCPWKMAGSPDETGQRIVIQYSESHLVHNHGPRRELIRDPNWRPFIKNTEARRRLGMSERWNSKAQAPLNDSGSRINKAGSTSSPRPPPSSSTTESSKRPRLSASTAVQDAVLPRSMSSLNSQPSTSLPARSILAQFVEPSPHSRLARTVPREQIPLSDVASFLAGLDPSLASLAPSLYSAGYDSFEMISAIVSYEPSTLERVLRTVVNATASVGREGGEALTVGLVQLLIKKLDEARKGGWA